MNIDYYDIKSEQQENGLWGNPILLLRMDKMPPFDKEKLHSAIIIALAEVHKTDFNIRSQTDDSCLIHFFGDVFKDRTFFKNMYVVTYENFMLDGNRLYYIKNEQERRYLKLNKINENV